MGLAKMGMRAAALFDYRWLASILLLFTLDLTTWLALTPGSGQQVVSHQDKLLHALGFCGLYIIGWFSLRFDWLRKRGSLTVHLVNLFFWLGYGCFIEAVQQFLPYRHASMADIAANAVGIAAGCLVIITLGIPPRIKSESP